MGFGLPVSDIDRYLKTVAFPKASGGYQRPKMRCAIESYLFRLNYLLSEASLNRK